MRAWTPRKQLAVSAAASAVSGWLLLRFPPELYGFYPACPFRAVTGYECPGCGATRALAAMLSGRFREAVSDNLLAVCLAPLILAVILTQVHTVWRHNRWRVMRIPAAAIATLFALTAVFGVARNLFQ